MACHDQAQGTARFGSMDVCAARPTRAVLRDVAYVTGVCCSYNIYNAQLIQEYLHC